MQAMHQQPQMQQPQQMAATFKAEKQNLMAVPWEFRLKDVEERILNTYKEY